MWLIHADTRELKEFLGSPDSPESPIPRYAILSHTWVQAPYGEVTFQDFHSMEPKGHGKIRQICPEDLREVIKSKGYEKIENTCKKALTYGIQYVWVDTCCIDKSNSAELQESISSMFEWYRNAQKCFVHLFDLEPGVLEEDAFPKCRWFKRGWTLQELIASKDMLFYDNKWNYRHSKSDLLAIISSVTHIDQNVLSGGDSLKSYSVATKMSWAANRSTTRTEDIAYCLMGIFGINMPLIYGEGGANAFFRLQKEIIKGTNDLTIFAWDRVGSEIKPRRLFASSPDEFEKSGRILSFHRWVINPVFDMTNKGLRVDNFKSIRKRTVVHDNRVGTTGYTLPLGRRGDDRGRQQIDVTLQLSKIGPDFFVRKGKLLDVEGGVLDNNNYTRLPTTNFYIADDLESLPKHNTISFPENDEFRIQKVIPGNHWDATNRRFFNPLDGYNDVMAVEGDIPIGSWTVRLVVCIKFGQNPDHIPIHYSLLKDDDKSLSDWVLSGTVTWDDVREHRRLCHLPHRIQGTVSGIPFQISISLNTGQSDDHHDVYSIAFEISYDESHTGNPSQDAGLGRRQDDTPPSTYEALASQPRQQPDVIGDLPFDGASLARGQDYNTPLQYTVGHPNARQRRPAPLRDPSFLPPNEYQEPQQFLSPQSVFGTQPHERLDMIGDPSPEGASLAYWQDYSTPQQHTFDHSNARQPHPPPELRDPNLRPQIETGGSQPNYNASPQFNPGIQTYGQTPYHPVENPLSAPQSYPAHHRGANRGANRWQRRSYQ
jgi:hypothetical protein